MSDPVFSDSSPGEAARFDGGALDAAPRDTPALDTPQLYINRELGNLEFHRRVLAQASDPDVPLLERLRFLTITSAILDEFFEIRVGGLKEQVAFGLSGSGPDGLGPQETLARIRQNVIEIVAEQYRTLNDVLLPALVVQGIVIHRRGAWDDGLRAWVREYFLHEVMPVLTPVGLDPAHPFPRVLNKSLNFIVSLDGKDAFGRKSSAAVVQAPRVLPRLIPLPPEVSHVPHGFVLLSSVVHDHVGDLFPGMKILGCHQFRVTRNSDLWIQEEEVDDLLAAVKGELPRRHFGDAVRLEVSDTCPPEETNFLLHEFGLTAEDLYRVNGPVNLNRLEALNSRVDRPDLKYAPFVPGLPRKLEAGGNIFDIVRRGDVLLHHPFQSFAPVIELAREAANDPDVLAIKQTVYRMGPNSPMADALLQAAQAGKEVTAVIELRARFDEAANIDLASRLQEAGAKVVYGIVGFKAHAKMLLVVRREGGALRRYVHLGTGNYNARTAREYTDFSVLTADEEIGQDVHTLFQQLTGLGRVQPLKKIVQTPFDLHERLLQLIADEERHAREGRESWIIAKMNSLIEPRLIEALYRASQGGVPVDLIVRGVCCLRPGVAGVSDNIRVRSILGRFLEHDRVFYFHAAGEEAIFCSSADWMPRNLFRRVEIAFPIQGRKARKRVVREGLEVYLQDDLQAWEMQPDGTYRRAQAFGPVRFSAQLDLLEKLAKFRG